MAWTPEQEKAIKHFATVIENTTKETFEEDIVEKLIYKEKLFVLEPCDLDTAVKNFERTDYNFYIFKDMDSNDEVAVLYKRVDGTIGLIRCR